MKLTGMCLIGCFLGPFATSAFAQDGDDDALEGQYPAPRSIQGPEGQSAVARGFQGTAGMVWARVLIGGNLSADQAGEPLSVAPDVFYGVTDELQVGLLHQGPMGWQARPGLGVCLTGKDHGCPKIYDNVGFDVMYGMGMRSMQLAAHGSFFVNSFDRENTSVALGIAGKVHFGNDIALFADPKINLALNDRDTNDDAVYVPVELQFQLGAPMTFKLLSGVTGSLSRFQDTYQVPAGVGLVRTLNAHLDLGARFSFDNLLGHQQEGADRADTRSLAILLNIRS